MSEPPLGTDDLIAELEYDNNGNRAKISYSKDGTAGNTVYITYNYNRDNLLTDFSTTGGPTFSFDATGIDPCDIDGLGRLKNADETISTASGTVDYGYTYVYDMRSQLEDADITKDSNPWWDAEYKYYPNGNLKERTIQSSKTEFEYIGEIMDGTKPDGGEYFELDWYESGNMKLVDPSVGDDTTLEYNWDDELQSATKGSESISLIYDPDGNRIWKQSTVSGQTTTRKYIVDITGDLPTILLEIGPGIDGLFGTGDDVVAKTYIYGNSQIIAQHTGKHNQPRYFYLHDRLGSVRQIIDTSGNVKNYYAYKPFGELYDSEMQETITNPFKFTGQYYDSEIDEYFLRARQYDPHIARFTARDPVFGRFREPLTLHAYLYCLIVGGCGDSTFNFEGTIAKVAIFNRLLPYKEIVSHYQAGASP